jgi:hypothetical protein
MNLMLRIVMWLLEFTILIGIAGGLVDLTRDMRREAYKAHKTGLISLKQLNQGLVGK